MSHTATALYASPNSQILESRILLNHASDPRFEFLKGRWKQTWETTKKGARAKRDLISGKGEKEKKAVGNLIGGYESSNDSDDDDDESPDQQDPPPPPPPMMDIPEPPSEAETTLPGVPTTTPDIGHDEAEKQRLRRLKAEEWKRKRASAKV